MTTNDRRMYSGTPCDACGGPTLALSRGSIWCPSEDAHPGGHFVTRVAFERSPLKGGEVGARKTHAITPRRAISAPAQKAKPVDPFAVGMDAFIGEDAK
jgi:hypothetical protein